MKFFPGRDERGRFLTNDSTSQQALLLVIEALSFTIAAIDSLDREETAFVSAAREKLEQAQAAASLVDVGQRP